jgi:hypothetical protein
LKEFTMPIEISIDGDTVSVSFPPDVSNAPVCIDTSSPDTIVTFPPPSGSRLPISIGLDGNGVVVTFPNDPPISIQTGDQVIVEFPTGGAIIFPRGQSKPAITVKDGKLILHKVEAGSENIRRVKTALE